AQPGGKVLGALAVVGMGLCYAVAQLITGRHLAGAPPPVVALGTTLVATVATLPAGIVQAPSHAPGWKAIGSVVVLGVVGTAFAFLLLYALIAGAGAAYTSLVTYLIPPIALAYAAIFLGERFGLTAFGGLAIIPAGVALGSGVALPWRRLASAR